MSWFKVDDGFATSKPVLRIPRRYRLQVVGLWTLAGTWSAKELTDGFIPDYVLEEVVGTPALAAHLVRVGLWDAAAQDGIDGWQYVGWEKYQPMRAEVMARREAEAERKRLWRESKNSERNANGSSSMSDDDVTGSDQDPDSDELAGEESTTNDSACSTQVADLHGSEMSQRDTSGTGSGLRSGHTADSNPPDPTRPDPSTYYVSTSTNTSPQDGEGVIDAEVVNQGVTEQAAPEPEGFAEWYATYPRKVARPKAAKAYASARKNLTAAQLLLATRRYAADPNLPREKRFIPHPATWLNEERWRDEPQAPRGSVGPVSRRDRQIAAAGERLLAAADGPSPFDLVEAALSPARPPMQAIEGAA